MKHPVALAATTVPSVGTHSRDGVVTHITVGGLYTEAGPSGTVGRSAFLHLTRSQAEALVYELASKLGLEVTP